MLRCVSASCFRPLSYRVGLLCEFCLSAFLASGVDTAVKCLCAAVKKFRSFRRILLGALEAMLTKLLGTCFVQVQGVCRSWYDHEKYIGGGGHFLGVYVELLSMLLFSSPGSVYVGTCSGSDTSAEGNMGSNLMLRNNLHRKLSTQILCEG